MSATINLGRVVGYSAYEVAVQNGFVGTEEEWLESLKGDDGEQGADAVNPFKGWYASANALPANPVVGNYAYVKGATATDLAAIYECNTAGTWSNSGRTVDTSNVQTFASNQEVNEVHIVNDTITGGIDDVLSAEQGKKLGEEIGNVKTKASSSEAISLPLFPGYYSYGVLTPSTTSDTTEFIDITRFKSILYTGSMGQNCDNWFDENGNWISGIKNINSNGNTLVDVEALAIIPPGARYLTLSSRNSTHSNPPTETPSVKAYPTSYYSLQEQIDDNVPIEEVIPISLQGYYNASGSFVSASTNNCTELIYLDRYKSIICTGSANGIFTWFDSTKHVLTEIPQTYVRDIIGGTSNSYSPELVRVDAMLYKPSGAVYLGISVRNSTNPSPKPICEMKVVGFTKSQNIFAEFGVVANGVTDTKSALQKLVDNCGSIIDFPMGTYVIGESITINPAVVKKINGNGAIIKTTGDFPAFIVSGTLSSSSTAAPDSLTNKIKDTEANTVIEGLKFTSSNDSQGTGIRITSCFEVTVRGCYFYKIKDGISFYGRNRNLIVTENHIYNCSRYGIIFDSGTNIHQISINNNHISYCLSCIKFDYPEQIANVQICGNDIEIQHKSSNSIRCIVINYNNTTGNLCGEIEICGNTIQGHGNTALYLIEIIGTSSSFVQNITICGNHISNSTSAIRLAYCKNITFSGNNYKYIHGGSVYKFENSVSCITMSGESVQDADLILGSSSSAEISNITVCGISGNVTNVVSISCAIIRKLVMIGCAATGNVTISASDIDYVVISNNCCGGAYTVASATHKVESGNI